MIALILNVAVLLGLASGGAIPQYTEYHHHHHGYHHQLKHHIKGTNFDSGKAELEAPWPPIFQPVIGLLLIVQNPVGLCREDKSKCPCYKGLSEKMTKNGDQYPFWTVETLWQGMVPQFRSQPQTLSVCNEGQVALPIAQAAFNELPIQKQQCLKSVWPPLDKTEGDCTEDNAVVEEGTIQGNCAKDYEHFSQLDLYYSQVAHLYEHVNGMSDSCRDCGGHHMTESDTDVPQPGGTAATSIEKIHIALTQLGLTNNRTTMIDPADLKKHFNNNVYLGCMQSKKNQGLNSWIITRIGFCFRCPRGNQPCDLPEPVDCWTDVKNPPSSVPWFARNKDLPCYTAKQKVCYCGFDRYADCAC